MVFIYACCAAIIVKLSLLMIEDREILFLSEQELSTWYRFDLYHFDAEHGCRYLVKIAN